MFSNNDVAVADSTSPLVSSRHQYQVFLDREEETETEQREEGKKTREKRVSDTFSVSQIDKERKKGGGKKVE